jgi:kumamolisin
MKRVSRLFLAIFAVLVGLAGALAAAAPSQAARLSSSSADVNSPAVALPGSAAPKLPAAAVRLGTVPADTVIRFDVTLKVRNQSALNAFLAGLADKNSPLFGHFLSAGQFGPAFGPTLAEVTAVRSALRGVGLSPGAVSANRLSIPVTASAAAVEHAFGTELVRYRLRDGRVAYAN